MTTATNLLTAVDQLGDGDLIRVFVTSQGDERRTSVSTLKAKINASNATDFTQYAAPSATGFSVQVNDDSKSVWLILTPTAGFAAGTLVLPAVAKCVHDQQIVANCTQAVTTLTVSGNGATVTGAPTTLAANGFFRLRFDAVTDTWYRVG